MEEDMNQTWMEIIARYTSMLKAYAIKLLPPHLKHLAEDAVNETFMRFFRFVASNNLTEVNNLGSYLRTITRRTVTTFIIKDRRKNSRNISLDEYLADIITPEPGPEDQLIELSEKEEERAVLSNLLDQLPERQKTAISLRIYNNLTYDQVAQEMATNEANVRNHVSKGTRTLKELYQRLKEEEGVMRGEKARRL